MTAFSSSSRSYSGSTMSTSHGSHSTMSSHSITLTPPLTPTMDTNTSVRPSLSIMGGYQLIPVAPSSFEEVVHFLELYICRFPGHAHLTVTPIGSSVTRTVSTRFIIHRLKNEHSLTWFKFRPPTSSAPTKPNLLQTQFCSKLACCPASMEREYPK